ncbi:amidohydrolase family protein [Paenibacillus wynnii]|uniref:amidohydrolase family protein n=1 Tax=Paenibacillus wynnii TaxID=268407 RepID=UPI00278CE405|nr:amidohydrolase family protein [Paenibacillus wynnii]MDQ0193583.1 cytosine deaminase [Paenibacillus wynnii]
MMNAYDLIVRNVLLTEGGASVDIGIRDGLIAGLGQLEEAAAAETLDAEGRLLVPPFVEPHVHLDTALTAGNPVWNESGTLAEGIEIWSSRKVTLTREDIIARAERTIRFYLGYGVLHLRSMVDIGDPKLMALEAIMEIKERYRGQIDIQVTAFPQDGIMCCPANVERMEEALRMGADGVSAVPHLEHTREEGVLSLRKAFDLADRSGAYVHVFCDETDDENSKYLEVCASLALSTGIGSRVTAAHANAAAYYNESYFQKVVGLVKRSGLSIVACPLINSVMQGRYGGYPKGRGITRIKEFQSAGINVALSHDDIRSPFYPLGTGNPLDAAHMAAHLAHMSGRAEMRSLLGMITEGGAAAMNLEAYSFQGGEFRNGTPASFLLFDAKDSGDLIRQRLAPRFVFRNGLVIAETLPAVTSLRGVEGENDRVILVEPGPSNKRAPSLVSPNFFEGSFSMVRIDE